MRTGWRSKRRVCHAQPVPQLQDQRRAAGAPHGVIYEGRASVLVRFSITRGRSALAISGGWLTRRSPYFVMISRAPTRPHGLRMLRRLVVPHDLVRVAARRPPPSPRASSLPPPRVHHALHLTVRVRIRDERVVQAHAGGTAFQAVHAHREEHGELFATHSLTSTTGRAPAWRARRRRSEEETRAGGLPAPPSRSA